MVETKLQNINAIEAKFSWDSKIENRLYLGISVTRSWSFTDPTQQLAYICDFILTGDSSIFHCSGHDGQDVFPSKDISVKSDQIHALRIELNSDPITITSFIDDQIVDIFSPKNPQIWQTGSLSYNIHLGADPLSSGKGYVDDVSFEKTK